MAHRGYVVHKRDAFSSLGQPIDRPERSTKAPTSGSFRSAVPVPHRSGLINPRPSNGIRDFERPNDFEPLEYGKDIVVELESFPTGLPTEIAAMGSHPPVSRPVPFPLIPRERLVDLGQRFDHHFGSTPDEPLTPYSVEHHDEIAGLRHWFATVAVIACQTGSGPLDPGDDQIGQFGRDLRGITE